LKWGISGDPKSVILHGKPMLLGTPMTWETANIQCGPPSDACWFVNPMNNAIVISIVNHSYWMLLDLFAPRQRFRKCGAGPQFLLSSMVWMVSISFNWSFENYGHIGVIIEQLDTWKWYTNLTHPGSPETLNKLLWKRQVTSPVDASEADSVDEACGETRIAPGFPKKDGIIFWDILLGHNGRA
jgi:hypothetical protein